jgi:hypothetical protein
MKLVPIWSSYHKRQYQRNERLQSYRHYFKQYWQNDDGILVGSHQDTFSEPYFRNWGLPYILAPPQTLSPGQNKVPSTMCI